MCSRFRISGDNVLNVLHSVLQHSVCALCSGLISIEEFRQTWRLFNAHLGVDIDNKAIDDLARSIDFNKDGSIDLTEFLEAFRVVHKLDNKDQPLSG